MTNKQLREFAELLVANYEAAERAGLVRRIEKADTAKDSRQSGKESARL